MTSILSRMIYSTPLVYRGKLIRRFSKTKCWIHSIANQYPKYTTQDFEREPVVWFMELSGLA